MEVSLTMPASKRALLATQCSLLTGTIRASALLPDAWLLAAVRRLTGTSQFPMGQKFLEKALLTFKRAMAVEQETGASLPETARGWRLARARASTEAAAVSTAAS